MTPANTAMHPLASRPLVPTAIYVRVSTEEQKLKGYSLPQQREACLHYAAQYGLPVDSDHIYEDADTGTIAARVGLDRLRLAVRRGAVQTVIFFNVSRFMRNFKELITVLDEFHRQGIEIYDTGTPPAPMTKERILNIHVQGAIAQFEHATIRERTTMGRRGRAEAGYPMPQHAPFGYRYVGGRRKGHYVIVEAEAAIVRRIFHLYVVDRLSIWAMANLLSLERVPTPRERQPPRDQPTTRRYRADGTWSTSTLCNILVNRTYIGTKIYGATTRLPRDPLNLTPQGRVATPETTWIPLEVPQIISPELFAQATMQRALNAQHSPRNTKHFYLLGASRLRCGVCKRAMGGNGKGKYRYYRCNTVAGEARVCRRSLHAGQIEAFVWEKTHYLLEHPEVLLAFFDAQLGGLDPTSTLAEQRRLEQAMAEAEAEADLLLDAYLKKRLSAERMHAKHQQIDQEQAARRVRLQALEDQHQTQREQLAYRQTITENLETFRQYCATIGDDGPRQQGLLDALGLTVVWWEQELCFHVRIIREPLRQEAGFSIASQPACWLGCNREKDQALILTYACPWPAGV